MDAATSILYGELGEHGNHPALPTWKRYPVQFNCRTLNTMTRWFRDHRSANGSIWSGGQHWAVNMDYCSVSELPREWRTWSNSDQEIRAEHEPSGEIRRLIYFGETPEERHIQPCWISGPDQDDTAIARGTSPRVIVEQLGEIASGKLANCALAPLRAIEYLTAAEPTWLLLNEEILLAYDQQALLGVVIGDRGF